MSIPHGRPLPSSCRAAAARRAPTTTLAAALLALAACSPAARDRGPRPHVLLVSIDSLRADHLSCYGYDRQTSPRIDRLAAEGALFQTVVSSTSWTLAAHAALFTSLPDSVHGAFRPQDRLPDDRVTLAERLGEAGYRTVGFYSGPFLHPAFGLAQGFGEWISCTSSDRAAAAAAEAGADNLVRKWQERDARAEIAHEDVTSPALLAAVKKWLAARAGDEPFFMFVHMWDPHYNYIPPPPYDTLWDPDYEGTQDGRGLWTMPASTERLPKRDLEHLIALYDGEITFTDQHVGAMVDELAAHGLLDDTLVVVTADHGEEFFEHGGYGHHRTLMDEGLLIPLVMRLPRAIAAGTRIENQVRIHDIAPTLLALAQAAPLEVAFGTSLLPYLDGDRPAQGADLPAFSELHLQQQESLRRPPWKAMRLENPDSAGKILTYVFDLENDRRERHMLPAENRLTIEATRELGKTAEHVRALRALLPKDGESAAQIPESLLEELRALGYIGG